MYLRLKLLFLALIITTKLWSQNHIISGLVYDANSLEPLSGVNILLAKNSGSFSDKNGNFKIQSPEKSLKIRFSFIGFETLDTLINIPQGKDSIYIKIALRESAVGLEQVVVTAGRSAEQLRYVVSSIESVKPELIENKNTTNLRDIMDQIPSVHVTDGQVNIRGGAGWSYGAGSRAMVMLDGLPMVSGDASQVQWSFLPVDNIKSLELIKGASSVLYGSSALNGVINIITGSPENLDYHTKITVFSGIYDKPRRQSLRWTNRALSQSGLNFYHGFKKKEWTYVFGASALKDEGFRMNEPDERIRVNAQITYKPEKLNYWEFSLAGNVLQGKNGSFLIWESYDLGYTPRDSGFSYSNTTKWNIDPTVKYSKGQWLHQFKGRWFFTDNRIDDGDPSFDQSNSSSMAYGEYYSLWKSKNGNFKSHSGATYMYSFSNSPLFQGNHSTRNIAVFYQAEQKVKKSQFTAGVRYENYWLDDYHEAKPVFRLGYSREMKYSGSLRASWGQGYRFPTIAETFILTQAQGISIFPNPDLRSESGWSAEIGYRQVFSLGGLKFLADLALYETRYDNMMEFTFSQWGPPSFPNKPFGDIGFKSLNTGKVQIRGIDFSLNSIYNTGKIKWMFTGSYTLVDSRSLEPDKVYGSDYTGQNVLTFTTTSSNPESGQLKYRYKHLGKLDVQASYIRFLLGLSMRANSFMENIDRAFVEGIAANFVVPEVSRGRLLNSNGTYIFDGRFGYEVLVSTKIIIVVNNILNTEYMNRPADLRAPRSFMLQISHKF